VSAFLFRASKTSIQMSIKKHVELIERGSEAWNAWRDLNPKITPDLSGEYLGGADLRRGNLRGADLSAAVFIGADLSNARLSHSNLSMASLDKANLSGADLSWANLKTAKLAMTNFSCANLSRANLSLTDLRGADLRGADLSGAELCGASLEGTDLSRASINSTTFANNDLSAVKGLHCVKHLGPSTIGLDTLANSNGKIPEVFLRGIGLPDTFITYLPSLIARPIEFYSCFISYSHADRSFARRLHDTLQGRGIRCWLDEHELLPGDEIYTAVDRGIRVWDKVLLCGSKDSLTSWWVDNEIKIAFDKEQRLWRERGKEVLALIPLNLDNYLFSGEWESGLATQVKARLAANFTGWEHDNQKFEEQIERLVKALRTDSGGQQAPPPTLL
jgi:hypothetical protein